MGGFGRFTFHISDSDLFFKVPQSDQPVQLFERGMESNSAVWHVM